MRSRPLGVGCWVWSVGILAGCRPPAPAALPPDFRFVDVGREAGLDFVHQAGGRPRDILRTTGSGLAWLDYDRDGWPDLFCVNSAPRGEASRGHRLYRNQGNGTFTDVTDRAGVRGVGQNGMGAAVGDYDGDGWPDLYVTCLGSNHLYRNRGDGRFEDVTVSVGGGGGERRDGAPKWSTAAAWWDTDGDGDLDLYAANYCRLEMGEAGLCTIAGVRTACPPTHYRGQRDLFLRNDEGRLHEEPNAFPIGARASGRGLGVLPFDADGDGANELFVANDGAGNFFFQRQGIRFRETAYESGLALDTSGADPAGMGVDATDVDGNGLPDLFLGNFQAVPNLLYRQQAPFRFRESSTESGLGMATRGVLTFGTLTADFNLDGNPEVLFVNGHVQDNIAAIQPGAAWEQTAQLFTGRGGRFQQVAGGPALEERLVGRGAALADYDRDGDEDVAVTENGGRVRLWRNESRRGHWLQVELRGRQPNPAALGARVILEAEGGRQFRDVLSGRSYLSDSDRVLTFGLGAGGGPVRLQVRWPGGRQQTVDVSRVDTRVKVEQAL